MECVEHIGRPVDKIWAGAREGGCLEAAAEFLGFFVERADVEVGVGGLEAGNLGGQKFPLVGPGLMPDRDRRAAISAAAASGHRGKGRKQHDQGQGGTHVAILGTGPVSPWSRPGARPPRGLGA